MNRRIIFIISALIIAGGVGLYKKLSSTIADEKRICVFSSNIPGVKDDVRLIRQALRFYDIKHHQIVDSSNRQCENASVKIFLEQEKFTESIKAEDPSLRIGLHLHDLPEEEDQKIICLFEEDSIQQLIELMENIIKKPLSCLVIYDENNEYSKNLVAQYQELAKIKGIKLQLCCFSPLLKRNVATILKQAVNINAVILIPSQLIFSDSELILEHFKMRKIPVFANHAGLIRSGALGGYDFDMQEIAHDIAEITNGYLRDEKTIKENPFEELYPQLHLNMDTIRHLGIQLESGDLLDEAVTVGGTDL